MVEGKGSGVGVEGAGSGGCVGAKSVVYVY